MAGSDGDNVEEKEDYCCLGLLLLNGFGALISV
jgi:hypothetical protein